jgi:S-adenosylmethionine synthetase
MSKRFIFSSESVGEGHPDKVCDTISDYVLDACLKQDKFSRVACECYAKSNLVVVGGEITTQAKLDFVAIARQAIRDIGYVHEDDVFHADKVFVINAITRQSPDIAQGVDARAAKGKKKAEQGAGDQGLMFGYACNETPELMPAPIMFAHRLGRKLTEIRKTVKNGRPLVPWLRPDAKSQVSVEYVDGRPTRITNVVISTQHTADVEHDEIEEFCIEEVIKKVLPADMLTRETMYLINPTGRFVVGGPQGDTGLTGRIPTAAWAGMAAARSAAKTPARWTAAPPTWAGMWRRTLWPPGWPSVAKSSSPTPSGIRTRFPCRWTPLARERSATTKLPAPRRKCSASNRRTSSSN